MLSGANSQPGATVVTVSSETHPDPMKRTVLTETVTRSCSMFCLVACSRCGSAVIHVNGVSL
jgi:hypothetical protein